MKESTIRLYYSCMATLKGEEEEEEEEEKSTNPIKPKILFAPP
jgi:hypothetical protein